MNCFWRLICRWRGHDEQFWEPRRAVILGPGRILEMPTPKLVEYLPPPPAPRPDVLAMLPPEKQAQFAMLQAFPMIRIRRFYCARCGEAWD